MEKRKRRRKKKEERRRSSSRRRRCDRWLCQQFASCCFNWVQTLFRCVLLLLILFYFIEELVFFFSGSFFFLTNPFVQDLKLSDRLLIFVLLHILSFLLDLIITSYRCIGKNSLEKLKQKINRPNLKNQAVGLWSVRVPAFFAWNGSSP